MGNLVKYGLEMSKRFKIGKNWLTLIHFLLIYGFYSFQIISVYNI